MAETISETRIPTIAHHHDFFWERVRFSVNAVNDYLRMAFPPNLPNIEHVVINTAAQEELALVNGRIQELDHILRNAELIQPGEVDGIIHLGSTVVVQEEGAQVLGLALGARPGESVLDACSGRGQKTSLLREQVGAAAELWAADLYAAKLEALEREIDRLQLAPVETRAVDWTVGCADVPADFDRVLVDAPCSGIGSLRRNPDARWRVQPGDPEQLATVQGRILDQAVAVTVRLDDRDDPVVELLEQSVVVAQVVQMNANT